jgi:hypothetical protein
MIASESLPAVQLGVQGEQRLGLALVREMPLLVELDSVERIDVRRSPIQEPAIAIGIVEDRRIPRAGRDGVRRPRRRRADGHRAWKRRKPAIVELEPPRRRCRRKEDRARLEGRLHQIHRVAHRERRRCDDVLDRPSRGRHEAPVNEVPRPPIATRIGREEEVLAALSHDDGIGTGAIRDPLVELLEVVLVVDVDRIAVGANPRALCAHVGASRKYRRTECREHHPLHCMRGVEGSSTSVSPVTTKCASLVSAELVPANSVNAPGSTTRRISRS